MDKLRRMSKPVGELKKMVSLVDRSGFDEFVYPIQSETTKFQPVVKPYHNFTQETVTWPFIGSPEWGKRITFEVPWPWEGDFLNWIVLRLKPLSWIPPDVQQHLGPTLGDWTLVNPSSFYVWANNLGTVAIALAEMEVDGVIVEQFSGDWINVWNRTHHGVSGATPWDDAVFGSYTQEPSINNTWPSEDGYIYCYLPFWFSRWLNTSYPLVSTRGPHTVRFHITLRPFSEVVQKLNTPLGCNETPLNKSFIVQVSPSQFQTLTTQGGIPQFETADILASVSYIENPLRQDYVDQPHEIMMNPVTEITFGEPLKYVLSKTVDGIHIQLPIVGNGPLKQILFFIRRKSVAEYNDWTNYSATPKIDQDPTWNPVQPLLKHAILQIGTATWADEDERWWRVTANTPMPGGIRGYGDYIYGYNFAEKPTEFNPSGSLNASRVDIRLNITVTPPNGSSDGEWTVSVFLLSTNWMRFQNSIANQVFMD